MSSYLEKYHLQKVQPVKNRVKQTAEPNRFKPKVEKISAFKMPYKQKQTLHKNYFPPQQGKPSIYIPKTEQLIRPNHTYAEQHHKKKQFFYRNTVDQEKNIHRSHQSLNFKSMKDTSPGTKIITSIQDFFTKILKPDNDGCTCGQPCIHAEFYYQWVDVETSIVKNHYFDMLYQYQQLMKKQNNATSTCSIQSVLSSKYHKNSLYEELKKNNVQIEKDIARTQSECLTFQNPQFRNKIKNILMCYGYEDPEIGYIQGMNMILSGLVFHIKDEVKTYAVFRKLILSIRTIYFDGFKECYEHIVKIKHYLKIHVNDLYLLFDQLAVDMNIVCLPWVLSLLTCLVPLNYLHLIYSGFISDSWNFFYKASLAIMIYHKEAMLQSCDASQILLIFSATNEKKQEYDWQDILKYAKSIKL